ncbi:MAG: ribonuclease PH [Candidatus Solincola sediminis]|uniref:Ribonuclease PH n=1 Tax=Candidatus Solincola sediminis TaxID=1797199 RepID=A0A1F2WPG2_9ACTN|nr:MAG: ribonuclease PH [Candidatus Solincola sediminis]OFW58739.1 MAG: ribonuclease PH [Candidatus Solincola sediminis]
MNRLDGRKPEVLRPASICRGYNMYAEGSALMEMGKTRVVCTASLEYKLPQFLRGSGRGWVTAEYGMLPRSTKERMNREASMGRPGGRTLEIQRLIGRSLRAVTDMSALGEYTIWVDCDVIQADGGTRTAAINGAYVALYDALRKLVADKKLQEVPLTDFVAAISIGIIDGKPMLDLDFEEDVRAEVDMNVVMTGSGNLVEIQGTAEKRCFERSELDRILDLAQSGIEEIVALQRKCIMSEETTPVHCEGL